MISLRWLYAEIGPTPGDLLPVRLTCSWRSWNCFSFSSTRRVRSSACSCEVIKSRCRWSRSSSSPDNRELHEEWQCKETNECTSRKKTAGGKARAKSRRNTKHQEDWFFYRSPQAKIFLLENLQLSSKRIDLGKSLASQMKKRNAGYQREIPEEVERPTAGSTGVLEEREGGVGVSKCWQEDASSDSRTIWRLPTKMTSETSHSTRTAIALHRAMLIKNNT